MDDINDEVRSSLDNLKAWLATRTIPEDLTTDFTTVSAPDGLRSIGFADLSLEKVGPHQDEVTYSHDSNTLKPLPWTELSHLVTWSTEFLQVLKNNKSSLAALELIRGYNEYPISVARFHVDEAINVVSSAINFEIGLDIQHPDTRAQNYAVDNILIEESTSLHDIIRQVFTCLYSKCLVRLVVRSNHFYSAALTSYLVDLMHQSGASPAEINCLAFDRRDSLGNEKFTKCIASNKTSKLSVIAVVFKQTDTFAAAQGIIESYFRELYPNLIVLVEESVYERFIKDWQRYYSHAVQIGSRLDNRTTVVDTFNSKVKIDLAAIDLKQSHKLAGNVINVLKFRVIAELMSLLGNLRKVPYMTVWNEDILLSREFCLRVNQCNEFWINHVPKSLAGRKFPEDILKYYGKTVAEDMTNIYNSVCSQFFDETEQLRKMQTAFAKKDGRLRSTLIIQAFTSMVTKSKSLRNGASISESVARLKRFHQSCTYRVSNLEPGDSRIEVIYKPVGLAILFVRDESSLKTKSVLVEFIFKNLLLGNAVLLACPVNTLGVKFTFDNDHVIPFKMVHESLPDISRLSLDNSIEASDTSVTKNKCPNNTYAVEIMPEMNSETCEAITIALGSRRKSVWYPDAEQVNYWSNE